MKITNITIKSLDIPFKVSFHHSSTSRASTETVIVTVQNDNGQMGIGEGCPRAYVTGETIESAIKFVGRHRRDFLEISSVFCLRQWIQYNRILINKNPAAFCSVEMAVLDLLSKVNNCSVESLLSLPELSGEFKYSAVLGTNNPKAFENLLRKYILLGMADFKLKLFGDYAIDSANIEIINRYKPDQSTLRFDANNLWFDFEDVVNYLFEITGQFFALEEPLQVRDFSGLEAVCKRLNKKIILDESFTQFSDFESIEQTSGLWILNVRISKMGGIIRSLEIAEHAANLGVPIIIGAQVGETSLLTRSAITLANGQRNNLLAQEGAFGDYLLQRDVVNPTIKFGQKGIVKADDLRRN